MRKTTLPLLLVLLACQPEELPPPDPFCGDGAVDTGEECDDGANDDGDGCEADCSDPFCGNVIVDPDIGEECDDGNVLDGDGCSPLCARQTQAQTAEDINGENPDGDIFAIFDVNTRPQDTDGDFVIDSTLTDIIVAISADDDLCQKIDDANGLANVNGFTGVVVQASKPEIGNVNGVGLLSGDTIIGTGIGPGGFFDPTIPFVSTTFEDGLPGIFAISESRGTLIVEDFVDRETLTVTFSDALRFDFSVDSIPAFDTDLNGDGTFDTKAIDIEISGAAIRAELCIDL